MAVARYRSQNRPTTECKWQERRSIDTVLRPAAGCGSVRRPKEALMSSSPNLSAPAPCRVRRLVAIVVGALALMLVSAGSASAGQ